MSIIYIVLTYSYDILTQTLQGCLTGTWAIWYTYAVTLKDVDKTDCSLTTTKHELYVWFRENVVNGTGASWCWCHHHVNFMSSQVTGNPTVAYLSQQHRKHPWWSHQMEPFSTLLALCAGNSPVTGEFPSQKPVTWSFDVFFDLRLNKRFSKQSWGWWFETPLLSLWCHCNTKLGIYWLVAKGIQQGPEDSPHKGTEIQKAFPCLYIFMCRIIAQC